MWLVLFLISILNAEQPEPKYSRTDCRKLIITNKPDDSVEYKAGVDVNGKPVAPADLPGNKTYDLGNKVIIPTELPLKSFAPSFPTTGNPYVNSTIRKSSIYSSIIEVDKDGSVKINGQPVGNEEEDAIRAQCRKLYPDLS